MFCGRVVKSVARRSLFATRGAATRAVPAGQEALQAPVRPHEAMESVPESVGTNSFRIASLGDDDIFRMLVSGTMRPHRLEAELQDAHRAARMRRRLLEHELAHDGVCSEPARAVASLPVSEFDASEFYSNIDGANCENVIGYMPLPVGVVGPLPVDGRIYRIPMATTEGALVASTNRGARAIAMAGGCKTFLSRSGMTRAPLLRFSTSEAAHEFREWVESDEGKAKIVNAFDSTSRFGRVQQVDAVVAGRNVFLRFSAATGDAMGMNMITKGVHAALAEAKEAFPALEVLALSGNLCTDKKPSAMNWIQGRGKSVSCEVRLSPEVLRDVLKTDADRLVDLNVRKNLIGSAMAGSVGGFNAHASNIVTAVFLATGQDPAQNVESSNCITLLEHDDEVPGGILASVTMPSVEVGTVGGGTSLRAQAACLDMLGVRGSASTPGANAERLARCVAASVLAGELSLMAALTTDDLLSAHIKLNRKPTSSSSSSSNTTTAKKSTSRAPAGRATPPHSPISSKIHHHGHHHRASAAAGGPAQLLSRMPTTPSATSPGRRFFTAKSKTMASSPFFTTSSSSDLGNNAGKIDDDAFPRLVVP